MFRHLSKAGCFTAALILSASVFSQDAAAQGGRPVAAARPTALETEVAISPELEEILRIWELRSGEGTPRMKGEFNRIIYDSVFQTAKVSAGRYVYEFPDKGRMDFTPDSTPPSDPPRTVSRGGVTFTVQSDDAKIWICDGEQILDIDTVKKEYNRVRIPPPYRGRKISDGPLPFLFGMKADKIKERYVLALGAMHNPEKIVHIVARPKLPNEQREYRVAEVLLDPVDFLPKAIQLTGTTDQVQTVYIFTKHDKPNFPHLPGTFKQPLFGYTLLLDEEVSATLERESKKHEGILVR